MLGEFVHVLFMGTISILGIAAIVSGIALLAIIIYYKFFKKDE